MSETSRAQRSLSEAMHEIVTIWINQGQEIVEVNIKAVKEMNEALKRAYSTAANGTANCGAEITQAARTNTVAALDVARDLMSAKFLPQAMEISNASVRKQFEVLAAQGQELGALTEQLMTETIKPITGSLPKVFERARYWRA